MKIVKKIVFTGGHHTSALVVAKLLQDRGWEIVWFGHRHSMWGDTADSAEYKEVTAAGIKFYDLKAGKFYKTFHPLKLLRIPLGFLQAFWWLLVERPMGIVSFGGYLAVPTVISGFFLGIPAVSHEQTVTVGWANKIIAIFAQKIAVAWKSSLSLYPRHKSVMIGLPLRPEVKKILSARPVKNSQPVIYFTGGKQGSHVINQVVIEALPQLSKFKVIHQTGSSTVYRDFDRAIEEKRDNYEVFDYDSHKAIKALYEADVVVGRAGAHTVYELGVLGKKAVLIPIPWASHQEQDKNAQILVSAGNAILLPEKNLNSAAFLTAIDQALKLKTVKLSFAENAEVSMVKLVEETFKKN